VLYEPLDDEQISGAAISHDSQAPPAGPLGASTAPCLLAGRPLSAGLSVVKLTTKVALCRHAQPG
jgi:hypothetical protein